MEDHPPRILLLGDVHTAEMTPLARSIREAASVDNLHTASNITEAGDVAKQPGWFPDLVVVCQNRSDEFSQADGNRLLSLFPLARWICCFGVWCESDGRNRDIWPTAIRIPARCAIYRIRHELAIIRGEASPLPLTASRDEVFGFDCPGDVAAAETPRTVCVASPDAELHRWIVDLLRIAGHQVVDRLDEASVEVLVQDVDPWTARTASELRDLCRRNSGLAIVALMTLAHPEDVLAVTACGVHRVVAKLTLHAELLDAVATALSHRELPAA